MTGIFCYLSYKDAISGRIKENSTRLSHRGEQEAITHESKNLFLRVYINPSQTKNNIVKIESLQDERGAFSVLDGAVYNPKELEKYSEIPNSSNLSPSINRLLYKGLEKEGKEIYQKLEGEFIHLVIEENKVSCARDLVGFNPIYYIQNHDHLVLSSELKALNNIKGTPSLLEPGTYIKFFHDDRTPKSTKTKYMDVDDLKKGKSKNPQEKEIAQVKSRLFELLDNAVFQIMEESENVCSLLSGGIDSTVICSLAQKYKPNLTTYTVAADNSSDLEYAKSFSKKYPSVNHKIYSISFDDLQEIITEVIYSLETFDAALIRSAIPMYYICSKVKEDMDIILTGEGADELFGGYHYLKDLDEGKVKEELIDMLHIEHALGLQRVDRIPYSFGLEAKAPWFNLSLVKYAFEVPMEYKIRNVGGREVEKWIIHETFKNIIPEKVYLRKKAKF